MSKVNCEAVGKRRQASLRMARAELLQHPCGACYVTEISYYIKELCQSGTVLLWISIII